MVNFFSKITNQYQKKLPFVAYKKPNEASVKALFQNDIAINYVVDFSESGFVFAPFDTNENSIIIPFENSLSTVYNQEFHVPMAEHVAFDLSDRDCHEALVEHGVTEIQNTALKKVVLSRVEQVDVKITCPIEVFKKALAAYPNAFVYLWYHPEVGCWIGATPEVLLQTRNSKFKTMALAGTQLFSDTLLWEAKEKEEQQLVTDYIIENLRSKDILPHVSESYTVKAGHLAHIRTDITGNFGMNNIQRLISVLHPTPAVCGLPKQEATTFIKQNETYNRRFYTGFLGELNKTSQRKKNRRNTENNAYRLMTTTSDLYVNLRCMAIEADSVYIYVGGGITASSMPEKEFVETCNKTKTMKKLIIS